MWSCSRTPNRCRCSQMLASTSTSRHLCAVREPDHHLIALLGDLEVAGPDFDVVDRGAQIEAPADLRNAAALARYGVDRFLGGIEVDVGRDQLEAEHRYKDHDEQHDDQPHQREPALTVAVAHDGCLPVSHLNDPKRPSSFRLSQMKNALPTMFSSGTKPHTRLSLELSLLSPIAK